MELRPLDRARIRRALRRRRVEHDPSMAGELNITPFLDVVVNVMLFLLATTAVTMTTVEVRASLMPLSPRRPGSGHELDDQLSATLTRDGVVFATSHGVVAPGCEGTLTGSASPSVPRTVDAMVDGPAVTRCARALHDELGGDSIVLGADADVPYEEVIRAMDALRADGRATLYPRVIISAGVR
jgi:biopolymer transport protein TolR